MTSSRSPTNTTSILIIGILAIGTFLSTKQFYTEFSSTTPDLANDQLLQTVDTSSSKSSRGGNSTTSNHLRIQKDVDDDIKDLPIAEELFEGANDNTDDGEKIISIAKNEDEDRDLPITDEMFEVNTNNSNYSDGSVDNVTNREDKNEDEDKDLPITNESLEVVANGNYSDGSVDNNITNIEDMNNQGNESSGGDGEEQVSSGKIIEETSNAKEEGEEESCFRPRRYNKSKSRLSTPCEFIL